MCLQSLDKYRDAGLLVLRIGLGSMFICHGLPKILGGPEVWEKVGMATSHLGIDFAPRVFGLLAGLAECGGGVILILGLAARVAAFFMFCVMAVAANMHLATGDGLSVASHAIENGIIFFSLIFIGPGKHSLDAKICKKA